MADNTTLNAGSGGDVIASDDISSVKHQRVKTSLGPDGTANDLRGISDTTTSSTTPDVGIAAYRQPDFRYSAVTLASALNSEQAVSCNGSDSVLVYVGTTVTGSIVFEVSADDAGTAYVNAEVRDTSLDQWVSGVAQTPASGKVYRVVTNGWRKLRVRVSSGLSGTVSLTFTLAAHSTIINGIDSGPAPHNFGYSQVILSEEVSSAQTSVAINEVGAGGDNAVSSSQRFVVTAIQIGAKGTTEPTQITIYFGTAAFSRGTSRVIFDHAFPTPSTTARPGIFFAWPNNPPVGAADEEVRMTTVGAATLTITVWGYRIPA